MDTQQELEALRAKIVDDTDVPEMVRKFLKEGAELQEIRLDEHGNWWHEGDIFENKKLAKLFHNSLHRTGKGNWVLKIKPYTYPVIVDLCGTFVARLIDSDGDEATARLRTGGTTTIDLNELYTDGDTLLATRVNGLPARIIDTAYRQLTRELTEEDGTFVITFDGEQYPLKDLPDGFFPARDNS
jgi:hypothetical protein